MNLKLGDTQLIIQECKKNKLSIQAAAYVLATAYWETGRTMKPVKEAYYVKNPERYRKNLRYYPWYGRGYVQLTWKENYLKAGGKLGLDLTTNPDAVMAPKTAVKILVIGSKEGWFTGKKLSDYINDTHIDYKGARRIINGTDKASTIASIAGEYEKSLSSTYYAEAQDSFENPLAAFFDAIAKLIRSIFK